MDNKLIKEILKLEFIFVGLPIISILITMFLLDLFYTYTVP